MSETITAKEYRERYATKPHKPAKKKQSNKGITQMKLLLTIEKIPFVEEYRFSKERKFRFDFAIPEKRIGIEFEGVMSKKSRHTTVSGYSKDSEKYNLAVKEGWRVLRYTILTYKNFIDDLKILLKK